MKIKYIMMPWALLLALVSCNKENGNDAPITGELAAPQVIIVDGTASFSMFWDEVPGAEGYRCEVTYIAGGRNVDILKTNTTSTSISVEALRPETEYTIRIAATRGGKASSNWFSEEKSTGKFDVSFEIAPYEVYNNTTGHIDYMAKVVPSVKDVYYWIASVTYDQKVDAKLWMEDEIADALEAGQTWTSLLDGGYIVKGDAESVFAFKGSDVYMFTAGILERVGETQINVVSEVSISYPFHAENAESKISHKCSYSDYLGEWVVKPYDVSQYRNSAWELEDAKVFSVNITPREEGRSFNMTGWGGTDNQYSSYPIVLDYADATSDKNEHFKISLPQEIKTEKGVKWAYTSWASFTRIDDSGVEDVMDYAPYDYDYDKLASEYDPQSNGWKQGFRGYVANANKTVIKILANTFKYDIMNVYIQSLWVCGMNEEGKYISDNPIYSLNGDRGGIPNATYYLVRKDVAEGLELPAPDVSKEITN